jgi:hypothetical protein
LLTFKYKKTLTTFIGKIACRREINNCRSHAAIWTLTWWRCIRPWIILVANWKSSSRIRKNSWWTNNIRWNRI